MKIKVELEEKELEYINESLRYIETELSSILLDESLSNNTKESIFGAMSCLRDIRRITDI